MVVDFHGEILFCAFLSMVVMRKTKVKSRRAMGNDNHCQRTKT